MKPNHRDRTASRIRKLRTALRVEKAAYRHEVVQRWKAEDRKEQP